MAQTTKKEVILPGQVLLNLSTYPADEQLLPRLPDLRAWISGRLTQTGKHLVFPIPQVLKYIAIGIRLGALGTLLIMIAIPILCCISHLPQ